jgi:hypothetical protein
MISRRKERRRTSQKKERKKARRRRRRRWPLILRTVVRIWFFPMCILEYTLLGNSHAESKCPTVQRVFSCKHLLLHVSCRMLSFLMSLVISSHWSCQEIVDLYHEDIYQWHIQFLTLELSAMRVSNALMYGQISVWVAVYTCIHRFVDFELQQPDDV